MSQIPEANNPRQFAVTICCPKCGTSGKVVWERIGSEQSLIALSSTD